MWKYSKQYNNERPAVVYVYRPTCMWSVRKAPMFDALAKAYPRAYHLNADEFGIPKHRGTFEGFPTLFAYTSSKKAPIAIPIQENFEDEIKQAVQMAN